MFRPIFQLLLTFQERYLMYTNWSDDPFVKKQNEPTKINKNMQKCKTKDQQKLAVSGDLKYIFKFRCCEDLLKYFKLFHLFYHTWQTCIYAPIKSFWRS